MIKTSRFLPLICIILITSCDLGGVKTTTPQDDVEQELGLNPIDTNNTSQERVEIPTKILADSVNGVPNDMVFQGTDGLRVEWTVKNSNKPLIQLNDVVMVNYKARVASGEPYDSNDEVGEPVPLKTNIGMMVKGWEAGLLKMHIGDKGRILIPAALGYGEGGYSTIVPPDADLIVDIEIVRKVEPVVLDEGVKVYTWKKANNTEKTQKNQLITFDYFAYTTGKGARMYDNSFKNSEPFSFRFENDNVIDGLHQGMSVLHANENAFIEIPANLAYGSKGLVDLVPKNTPIVYDVRILRIEK